MIEMASQLQKTFGQRVRDCRERQGLSQSALAKKLGMHQPDLCDLEKGRHSPTLDTVEKIAVVLDVDPQTLLSTTVSAR